MNKVTGPGRVGTLRIMGIVEAVAAGVATACIVGVGGWFLRRLRWPRPRVAEMASEPAKLRARFSKEEFPLKSADSVDTAFDFDSEERGVEARAAPGAVARGKSLAVLF